MEVYAIKLRFNSPVHISKGNENDMSKSEIIFRSDALKSAIFAVGLGLYPEWTDKGNEKSFFDYFSVSSCFPFAKDEYFLPKPPVKTKFNFKNTETHLEAKKSKKIQYLNLKLFTEIIKKQDSDIDINEDLITPDGVFICESKDTFVFENKEQSFFETDVQQRVQVNVNGEDSLPYYVERVYFRNNCGLYFFARFDNENIKNQVFNTLQLLADTGIGTDKSVGNGTFDFDINTDVEKIQLPENLQSQNYLTLGLFLPEKEEYANINFDNSIQNLINRGGYMGGSSDMNNFTFRKKTVFMFTEMCLLNSNKPLTGKYVNLKPDALQMHNVWRDGKCLMLKI